MKRMLSLALAGSVVAPWSLAQAVELNDDFSLALEVSALSEYRSRGLSQTLGDPALQGSATLMHSSGLYAGVWTSNVDFGLDRATRQELDYYAGYYWQISDDIALDVSYIDYNYPRYSGFNYGEYFAELSAWGMRLGGVYSKDLWGDQSMFYAYLGYGLTLPGDMALDLRYGRADYKDPLWISASGSDRDYYDEWEVKLSKELFSLNWSLSYVDTDLSKAECTNYWGYDNLCSAALVAGVSKSF